MDSVSSINPALTSLMQTLSNVGFSVKPTQTAFRRLADASPVDVVDLSDSANRVSEREATVNQALQSDLAGAAIAMARAEEVSISGA